MTTQLFVLMGALLAAGGARCGTESEAGEIHTSPAPEALTPTQLLDRYAATQAKLTSFILRYVDEYRVEGGLRAPVRSGEPARGGYVGELRSDGRRCYGAEKTWGDPAGTRIGVLTLKAAEADPRGTVLLWDGAQRWQYLRSNLAPDRDQLYFVPSGHREARGDDLVPTSRCRILFGYFEDTLAKAPYGFQRIDTELRQAESVSALPGIQQTGTYKCRVVTARSAHSQYRLWFDIEHDYHVVRTEIHRGGAGVNWGRPEEIGLHVYLKHVTFVRSGEVWVPKEADYGVHWELRNDARLKEDHRLKLTQYMRSPNHDELRSFAPSFLRSGSPVSLIGQRGNYRYREGRIVDKSGRAIYLLASPLN